MGIGDTQPDTAWPFCRASSVGDGRCSSHLRPPHGCSIYVAVSI